MLQLYYFSGTGNARACAAWMEDEVRKAGEEAEMIDLAGPPNRRGVISVSPAELEGVSMVGFLSPTHGFHLPAVVRTFMRRFPPGNGRKAFMLNTRAGLRIGRVFLPGLSGLVHYWAWLLLRLKGYRLVGLIPADLPSNWLSLHPAVRKKGVKKMYQRIEPKIRRHARNLMEGGHSYRALISLPFDLAVFPVTLAYVLIGRFFLAKSFLASSACNNCNLCKKSCPVGAIREVGGRMYWSWRCESCMRCMNNCPHRAVETSHGFIALIIWLSSFATGVLVSRLVQHFGAQKLQWLYNGWVDFLLVSVVMVLFVFLGYRLMHFLLRFRFFERLFVLTALTRFRFWGRYRPGYSELEAHTQ